ncbi:MAG: hypothetical protein JOZ25_04690 [Actinobacteria bacterium]|nr:hypothetical protein [Actinomycetota bacterium]
MSWLTRLNDAQYAMLQRIRHREALEAGSREGTASDFSHLRGKRQALVVTPQLRGHSV